MSRTGLRLALLSFILTVFGAAISFILLQSFVHPSHFGFRVAVPTAFDGIGYSAEIIGNANAIVSLDLSTLLSAYGLFVILFYSPAILLGWSFWCLFVNSFLLSCSFIFYAIILSEAKPEIIPLGSIPYRRFRLSASLVALALLVQLNPYYIVSMWVPSKDILSLFLVSLISYVLFRPRELLIGSKISLILLPIFFFVRISIFAPLLLVNAFLYSKGFRTFFVGKFFGFRVFLVSYLCSSVYAFVRASPPAQFESLGSGINLLMNSPFKFILAPFVPVFYGLWDFFKPLVTENPFHSVVFSFSWNSFFVAVCIFVFLPRIFLLSYEAISSNTNCSWLPLATFYLAAGCGVVMSNSFVHPRYMYEYLPLAFVVYSATSLRGFLSRLDPGLLVIFLILLSKCLQLFSGFYFYNEPSIPYELPPFLAPLF